MSAQEIEELSKHQPGENEIKIVLVGDGSVGKTCIIQCYYKQEPITNDSYIPTVFDMHKAAATYKDQQKKLLVWDTAGQQELGTVRLMAYPYTNVFLLCFSLNDKKTFKNITSFWKDELKDNGPNNAAIVLVGTKKDLREQCEACKAGEDCSKCVKTEEGK